MRTYPFEVELDDEAYLALLKGAAKGKPLTQRLVVAEQLPGPRGRFRFRGSHAEGLALHALALVSAPSAVVAISRALARAEKVER